MKLERGTPSEGSLPEAIVRSAPPPPPPPSLPIPYLYLQESVLKCVKAGFSLAAESCEHLWPSAEAWCFCLVKINKTKDVSRVRSSTESERNNQLSLFCRLRLSRETLSLTIWWKPGFRSRKQTRKNTSQSQSLPYRSSVIRVARGDSDSLSRLRTLNPSPFSIFDFVIYFVQAGAN